MFPICSVLWDFLHLAVNVVESLRACLYCCIQLKIKFRYRIKRLYILGVQPNEDQAVAFNDVVLQHFWLLSLSIHLQEAVIVLGDFFYIMVGELGNRLGVQGIRVHAFTSSSVECPAVERTFNAAFPLNLTPYCKICAKMSTEGGKPVHYTIFTTEKGDVATTKLNVLHISTFKLPGWSDTVPTVSVTRHWISSFCIASFFWKWNFLIIKIILKFL